MLITGNGFKSISDYILDENGFIKTDINNNIPIYFVKTDLLDLFYKKFKPNFEYKLISHNSDLHINELFLKLLNDRYLVKWFGQNIEYFHPKLSSIPIGIANEIWEHGDQSKFQKHILEFDNYKEKLIYCNFDVSTNPIEREKCIQSMIRNKITIAPKTNFDNYLQELQSSFFSISPNGNGVDCHKTWESMYLKTVPIVTKSINISFYTHYPLLIIKDWETFDKSILSKELYNEIMTTKNFEKYEMNKILEKIQISL